jgi:hypothetical protein
MSNPLKNNPNNSQNAVRINGSSSVKPNASQSDLKLNFNGINSNTPNQLNATDIDNESNRTPTMTIENESVFNS